MDSDALVTGHARGWAATVLRVLRTPWPYAAGHLSLAPDDCDVTPDRLHPMFHGSLDWHSSCHMQWSAIRLLTADLPGGQAIDDAVRRGLVDELETRLTLEHGRVEAAYLLRRPGFERPYGWGWLVALVGLAERVAAGDHALAHRAGAWREALDPVADAVGGLLLEWLPNVAYPVRHGTHANTAFGLSLARDGFTDLGRLDLVDVIDRAARGWYLADADYPSAWEPSGADFLSPALCEADLMRRVLSEDDLVSWLRGFLPGFAEPDDALLRTPVVLDPTDGHAVHLFGLALSRAAQLSALCPAVEPVRAQRALASAAAQTAFALDAIESGDFMSTHWLVSFALLGLCER